MMDFAFAERLRATQAAAHARRPDICPPPPTPKDDAEEAEYWRTKDPQPKRPSAPRAFGERLWAAKALAVRAKSSGLARWYRLLALSVLRLRWLTADWLFRAQRETEATWWSSTAGRWVLARLVAFVCRAILKQQSEYRYASARRFGGWVARSPWSKPSEDPE